MPGYPPDLARRRARRLANYRILWSTNSSRCCGKSGEGERRIDFERFDSVSDTDGVVDGAGVEPDRVRVPSWPRKDGRNLDCLLNDE